MNDNTISNVPLMDKFEKEFWLLSAKFLLGSCTFYPVKEEEIDLVTDASLKMINKERANYDSMKNSQNGCKSTPEEVDIDEALEMSSPCGRFQMITQVTMIYIFLTVTYNFTLTYFTGADPSWTCISKNSSEFCADNYGKEISSSSVQFSYRCQMNRSEWKYTTSKKFSFVTEFDLVCQKTTVAALVSSAFYMGGILGAVVSGTLTDTYGRKLVIHISLLGTTAASIGCSYVEDVWQLTVLNAMIGAFSVVCYFTTFVYQSEFATPTYRAISGTISLFAAAVSNTLIDATAYFIQTWRNLQFYASLPCLLVIFVTLFLPESPRWLLATGKVERATKIMKNICKFNGHQLINFCLKPQAHADAKKLTYIDLFRSCKVSLLTLSLGFMWFTIALVYYAIALESSNIGGNMYQAFALSSLADIGGAIICPYTCNRFGRKKSILGGLSISGILIASMLLVPRSLSYRYIINIVVMILARVINVSAFYGIYTWTFELFPTVLRSQGMSVCIIFERTGLLAVPFITRVLNKISYKLPFIIMSTIAILASILGLILPETNKLPTRENYEDFFEKHDMEISVESGNNNKGMTEIDK